MNLLEIDFTKIGDYETFYKVLAEHISLPEHFGENLDALWDVLSSGEIVFPKKIVFTQMSLSQLETFEDLLICFEKTEEETNDFEFSYRMEQYDNEE